MMAHSNLFAAVMLALFTIALEPAAGINFSNLARRMNLEWDDLSRFANPGDDYLFAEKFLTRVHQRGNAEANELLKAWKRVLHKPDLCDDSSLKYMATIAKCEPEKRRLMRTLYEETQKYASKCLTPDHIKSRVESQASVYSLKSRSNNITEFIDDQFIADYWSANPEESSLNSIKVYKATKAIAKAITRDSESKTTELENEFQVQAFLKGRLYNPCSDYYQRFEDLDSHIKTAASYWKGGYDNLISSLDKNTRNALFRYKLCKGPEILFASYLPYKPRESFEVSERVVSELKNLKSLTAS